MLPLMCQQCPRYSIVFKTKTLLLWTLLRGMRGGQVSLPRKLGHLCLTVHPTLWICSDASSRTQSFRNTCAHRGVTSEVKHAGSIITDGGNARTTVTVSLYEIQRERKSATCSRMGQELVYSSNFAFQDALLLGPKPWVMCTGMRGIIPHVNRLRLRACLEFQSLKGI